MMNKNNKTLANWVGVKGKCTIFITVSHMHMPTTLTSSSQDLDVLYLTRNSDTPVFKRILLHQYCSFSQDLTCCVCRNILDTIC